MRLFYRFCWALILVGAVSITAAFRETEIGSSQFLAMTGTGVAMILLGLGLGYWMITAEDDTVSFRERYQSMKSSDELNLEFLNQPQVASPATAREVPAQGLVVMPPGSRPPVRQQAGVPAPSIQPPPVACPHCGNILMQDPQFRGMAVACPHCQQPFLMP